jgi:hypothetical protein
VAEFSDGSLDAFLQQALFSATVFDYAAEAPSVRQEGGQYRSRVEARRLEAGIAPVEVMTTFADGTQRRELWDGLAPSQSYEYTLPSPAVQVEVDPERKLLLDTRWANNSRTSWFQADPILRRAGDLLWLMQGWLKWLGYGL